MATQIDTASAWSKFCLNVLQQISSDYRKNKEVKGRFIEIIREDSIGLVVSHNFVKIRDCIYYSFSLQFLTKSTVFLHHPLVAGSRFDDRKTIWRQFHDDLGIKRGDPGYPPDIWCSGRGLENNLVRLVDTMKLVEARLLPFYRTHLATGKKRLVEVFTDAQRLLEKIPEHTEIIPESKDIREGLNLLKSYERECYSLDAFKITTNGILDYGYGAPRPGFAISSIPTRAIVLSGLNVFIQERTRIADIINIAENL